MDIFGPQRQSYLFLSTTDFLRKRQAEITATEKGSVLLFFQLTLDQIGFWIPNEIDHEKIAGALI